MCSTNIREDITLSAAYYNYRRARTEDATVSPRVAEINVAFAGTETDSRNLGQAIELSAKYDYTEDVVFGACGGIFEPGTYFGEQNDQVAYQTRVYAKVDF